MQAKAVFNSPGSATRFGLQSRRLFYASRVRRKYSLRVFVSIMLLAVIFSGAVFCLRKPANHIINLSLPRSGTVSFAGVFDQHGSTHEFMLSETINALLDYRERKISRATLKQFLIDRQNKAGHRIDSASFFFLAPDVVLETFPDAAYFFSVRGCEAWIVSMVDNAVYAHKVIREGRPTVDLSFLDRYSELFIHNHSRNMYLDTAAVKKSAAHIVHDLAKFWRYYTLQTLNAMLPLNENKRLIIRLEKFNTSLAQFARLAGVPVSTLNTQNIHLNKDRSFTEFRQVLGIERLSAECSAPQTEIDSWLSSHAVEAR